MKATILGIFLFLLCRMAMGGSNLRGGDEETDPNQAIDEYEYEDGEIDARRLHWNPKLDVTFIVDGSGSIDNDDWKMQIDGLQKVILDTNVVSRNGDVGITVIQYADNPRVEVEHTFVSSLKDVIDINGKIDKIQKWGGTTHTSEAVERANEEMEKKSRRKARQIYCLTTDAADSAGKAPLFEAIKQGKRSKFKLDSFNVVAIGQSGTSDQEFHAFYDDLLVDGVLDIAKTNKDFENFVKHACFDYKGADQVIENVLESPKPNAVYEIGDEIKLKSVPDKPFDDMIWTSDGDLIAWGPKRATVIAGDPYLDVGWHTIASTVVSGVGLSKETDTKTVRIRIKKGKK